MRNAKRFPRRAYEITFKCFFRRERERMEQKIDMIGFAADFFKEALDLGVARNVAGEQRRFFSESGRQFLNIFFQPLALVIKNQTRARGRPRLSNCPGNAALIRNTENNSNPSF